MNVATKDEAGNRGKYRNFAGRVPRIAMVGCGYWGKNLARNFAALGALDAICESDEALAEAMTKAHGAPVRPFEAVLGDPAIEAVALAVPAEAHGRMVRAALLADKHVFVEKPLALRVPEAEEIVALARERDRVLMVGHLLHYHPAFLKLKEMVEEGAIGRLRYLYSTRANLGKIRQEEDVLWSFAPHDLSMILALAGEEPSGVSAVGAHLLGAGRADATITHMAFPGGAQAHVFVSWLNPFKEQRLVVVGERGMLVFDDTAAWERKLLRYGHEIAWVRGAPEPRKAEAEPVAVAAEEPLRAECRHFLDCAGSGARPRTDGEEGLRVLKVLDAASRSLAGGRQEAPSADPLEARDPWEAKGVFVHETARADAEVEIGEGTKIWHFSHILKGARVGRNCTLGQNVMVGREVIVGDRCKIQNNVSVYEGVTLEDGVFCGPSCVFTNVMNPRAEIERKDEFRPTLVRRGATIGANATIVCGTTLGRYAFIAAGAVVTADVPDYALMAGVPARRIGWMSAAGERLGPGLVCPRTGARYRETGEGCLEPCGGAAGEHGASDPA